MKKQLGLGLLAVSSVMGGCLKTSKGSSVASADAPASSVSAAVDCSKYQLTAGVTDHWAWLNQNQDFYDKVFGCASLPKALPTGSAVGHGSVRGTDQAWFNNLQATIGASLWAGKVLTAQPDGTITLLNKMVESGDLRYNALVRWDAPISISGFDGKPSVILDYRIDKSAQDGKTYPVQNVPEAILDPIIHAVRDEIREVQVADASGNLSGSGFYVGRANLFKGFGLLPLTPGYTISDVDFANPNLYFLGANFSLDFSPGAK